MSPRFIPLFPLHVVVFPRTRLPLHIFEDRYKDMVGAAIRDKSEFGMVLAQDDGIATVGCTVSVEDVVQRYEDGRMDIMTRGVTRFEVTDLNEEQSCLRGTVSYFDDDDFGVIPPELRAAAIESYRSLRAISSSEGRGEADLEDPQVSFQLAQMLPDLELLYTLLRERSEGARLARLTDYLQKYVPRQRDIERVKAAAPTNGFGGKHAEHK